MDTIISTSIEPLIKRKIFKNEKEAIQELLREYILKQIATLRRRVGRFERKYGMRIEQFNEYLHERSLILESGDISSEQRRVLGQAIMQEEDDILDWKASQEMLESWLGIRDEVTC